MLKGKIYLRNTEEIPIEKQVRLEDTTVSTGIRETINPQLDEVQQEQEYSSTQYKYSSKRTYEMSRIFE